MRWFFVYCVLAFCILGCTTKNTLPEPRPSTEEDEEEAAPRPPAKASAEKAPNANESAEPSAAPNASPQAQAAPTVPTPPKAGASENKPDPDSAEALALAPLPKRPQAPLSLEERRARTTQNLYKISRALDTYIRDHKRFPGPIYDRSGKPLLSWRVRLLPALGYEDLADQFHANESWDSKHNRALLASIPPPFQSPERFDARTNYLAPIGAETALRIDPEAKLPYASDGFAQTILVVEADEARAIPWTKPEELPLDPTAPRQGLGGLREDGFFAVLGRGKVHVVTREIDDATVASFFSVNKDRKRADTVRVTRELPDGMAEPGKPPPVEPLLPGETRVAGGGRTQTITEEASTAATAGPYRVAPSDAPSPQAAAPANDLVGRAPVPDEAAQESARKDMRDLFQNRYKEAKKPQDRAKIATELLQHASRLGADSVGKYVVLRTALEIASGNGDIKTSKTAAEKLVAGFQVHSPDLHVEVIRTAARSLPYDRKLRSELAEWAQEACDDAYAKDDYAAARELYQIALSLARSAEDRELQREVMSRFNDIESARREYGQVAKVIESLQDTPDNPQANLVVGRYFCFVKEDWERGLPFLERAGDRRLAELAVAELSYPADPVLQAQLADAWWEISEDYSDRQQQSIQKRAASWYRQALANLPNGLTKVKAEIRLKEIETEIGKQNDQTLGLFSREDE